MSTQSISQEYLEMLACPVCKSAVIFIKEEIQCLRCGELYQCVEDIPIMLPSKIDQDLKLTIQSWNDFYKGMSDSDLKKAKDDYRTMYVEDTLKYLERYWGYKRTATYFEVGCGPAFLGLEMAKRGYLVNATTSFTRF